MLEMLEPWVIYSLEQSQSKRDAVCVAGRRARGTEMAKPFGAQMIPS